MVYPLLFMFNKIGFSFYRAYESNYPENILEGLKEKGNQVCLFIYLFFAVSFSCYVKIVEINFANAVQVSANYKI